MLQGRHVQYQKERKGNWIWNCGREEKDWWGKPEGYLEVSLEEPGLEVRGVAEGVVERKGWKEEGRRTDQSRTDGDEVSEDDGDENVVGAHCKT